MFGHFYNEERIGNNPLFVVPTGGGKSHILGMFCKEVLQRWPDQKILVLTHVDTIIQQDYLAIKEHLPASKVGIFSAGVGRKERRSVTVAGIQSIHTKARLFKDTTLILIDEAHTVPPKGYGQYRSFLSKFNCPILGVTATHFRMGSGYLHEGDGAIFTDVAYEVDIERLINEGWLCKLIPRAPEHIIDITGVKTQNGDYVKKELKEAATREGLTEAIIQDLVRYREHYKKWLIFTIDIEHCEYVSELLTAMSISNAIVHSKMPKAAREEAKLRHSRGEVQALISVETLTTGYDSPEVDLIALMRPTKSPVLHIQMIGRGLRIHPSKEHCLVLDYAGNVLRLGAINDVQIKRKGKGGGQPITKTCPQCKTIHPGSVRVCFVCGHTFEFKTKLTDNAGNEEVVKKTEPPPEPQWAPVTGVSYSEYKSRSGKDMMLVTYRCGLRSFFEYKSFDQRSRGGYHTRHWWMHRAIDGKHPPTSSKEAVIRAQAYALKIPTHLYIDESKDFPIIDYKF